MGLYMSSLSEVNNFFSIGTFVFHFLLRWADHAELSLVED